jgi:ABC-type transport system involved in cytochrome c biogenesis permease subunit
LLTIGILSGAVWANQTWFLLSWDPKETWALITWFVFAIYLHTRISKVGPVNDQRLLLSVLLLFGSVI